MPKVCFKLWLVILASVHATLFWILQFYQQIALGSFFESYWDSSYKMNTLCINKYREIIHIPPLDIRNIDIIYLKQILTL